ncbi:hypothetical protein C6501_05365 [Candidatus Poribacteria bacterium]|nr:MAG: hypothetical protein C6501_05365 [Candidatus Poribacteria bacterium]
MKLRFDESEIQYWACKYVNDLNEEETLQEEELLALELKIKARGYLLKDELVKVAKWKWPPGRPAALAQENSDDHIKDVTSKAFQLTDIDDSLKVLRSDYGGLRGVLAPIGSAILHLYHKDPYPIYDPHALRAVGERKGRGVWRRYVKYCRELVAQNEVDIRTLDRALWKYSKGKNS